MPGLGEINREEKRRVKQLKQRAKEFRTTLRASRRKDTKCIYNKVSLSKYQLGWQLGAIGDLLIKNAVAVAEHQLFSAENRGVVHVKDGKPLTAHGAKLLGVPWPQDQ